MSPEQRAELRTWVVESRRRQGLPERVGDPAVLARARELLKPHEVRRGDE